MNFRNRKIAYYVDLLEGFDRTIKGLPSTSVDFDTWDSVPFKEHGKERKPKFKDKDLDGLWEWSHGKTYKQVGLHPQEANRIWKKFVKVQLEHSCHMSQ